MVSDYMIEYRKGHHKHKRQDLFLPFVFIRDVRSLEPKTVVVILSLKNDLLFGDFITNIYGGILANL